jgi:DNA-binding NtrC family response regulator
VSSGDHSICLVDDDPSVLKSVARLLASHGLSCTTFSNPLDFLAYARSHGVPLAIVDIEMPDATGLEVLQVLRTESPATKVILITANDTAAYPEAAAAGGAHAFILKPFDGDAFLLAVRETLPSASGEASEHHAGKT